MRSWVTAGISASCLCLILGGSGCYAGAVGIALGITASAGRGGGGGKNADPVAQVGRLIRKKGGYARLDYTLTDDHKGFHDVVIEWQSEGSGDWFEALEATGEAAPESQGTRRLQVPVPNVPQPFVFVWDAKRDLERRGRGTAAKVKIGVRSLECKGESTECRGASEGYEWAGNSLPEIVKITTELNPSPDLLRGPIVFSVFVKDRQSDPVTLEGSYRVGPGGEPHAMRFRLQRGFSSDDPGGQENTMVWESESDAERKENRGGEEVTVKEPSFAGRASDDLYVEFRARDDLDDEPGKPGSNGPLFVDNNSNPTVEFGNPNESQQPADKSFQIPISLLLKDEEGDPVLVILQWTAEGEDFEDIEALHERPFPGKSLNALVELVRGMDEKSQSERRRLHILSPAPARLRGALDASGLPPGQILEPDFVRKGLTFRPPTSGGNPPREKPGGSMLLGDSEAFLIGREIEFPDVLDLPAEPMRIIAFDPRTSLANLDPIPSVELPGGTRYELALNCDVAQLSSRTGAAGGSVHHFVWDALKDMKEAGRDFSSTISLRATAVDSDPGAGVGDPPEPGSIIAFRLKNDLLSEDSTRLQTDVQPTFVAVGDVNGDAKNDVVVLNKVSKTVIIYRGTGKGLPQMVQPPLQTGDDPQWVGIGNVSEDPVDRVHRNDILVVNAGSDTTLVYLQQKNGEFLQDAQQTLKSNEGLRPVAAAVGNLDGEPGNDVVVAHEASPEVWFFLQEGGSLGKPAAGFRAPNCRLHTTVTGGLQSVLVARVDGDDRDDIIITSAKEKAAFVYLQGDPPWLKSCPPGEVREREPDSRVSLQGEPVFATLGDVAGDGGSDLVVADLGIAKTTRITLYTRDPSNILLFERGQLLEYNRDVESRSPVFLAVGDVNSDRRNDILVSDPDGNKVHVYLQGDSGFPIPPNSTVAPESFSIDTGPGSSPRSLAIGDVAGDERSEVLVPTVSSGQVRVYHQMGIDSFPAEDPLSRDLDGQAGAVALGEVSGDGLNELLVATQKDGAATGRLSVYQLKPTQSGNSVIIALLMSVDTATSPSSLAIGDLDGDGQNDVLVGAQEPGQPGTVNLYLRADSGGLAAGGKAVNVPDTHILTSVSIGDVNGDGRNDAVVLTSEGRSSSMATAYLQGSGGIFGSSHVDLRVSDAAYSLAVGDVNGDGRNDVVVGSASSVAAFLQPESNVLEAAPSRVLKKEDLEDDGPFLVALGDVSADGRNDLAVIHTTSQGASFPERGASLYVQDQDPRGDWVLPPQDLVTSARPTSADIGDLDGDGLNDLVVVSADSAVGLLANKAEVFLQDPKNGRIVSQRSQVLDLEGSPGWVVVGDLNGDWRDDIAVARRAAPKALRVYLAR